MKIGSKALPIDVLDDDSFEESAEITQFVAGTIQRQSRVPDVKIKYATHPPNCDPADCTPSHEFLHMKSQVAYFNPIQSMFMREVEEDKNIVVCGSTSCGKTTIAEMATSFIKKTYPNAKVAYISPLKALASEKQADWTSPNHDFYQYNLSILTGDFILTEERKHELANSDIICMSTEMLGSRIRRNKTEKNQFLNEIKLLIVDEAHLLTTASRGSNLEVALMKFTKVNPGARIVFLSATMPNVQDMGDWLTLLNGKKTTIVKSDYRPVKLKWNWEVFPEGSYYAETEENKALAAISTIHKHPRDKFLLFVHAKKTGRRILDLLHGAGIPTKFHNADLSYNERLRIESDFRSREPGSLRVLISTSTLAWGLNMPARRVIITGITRGQSEVEPLDITQMGGRAGRVGLDDEGDVHVLVRDGHKKYDIDFCTRSQDIVSQISDMDALAFHLVSEIAEGNVRNKKTALAWFSRSLAHFQKVVEQKENKTPEQLIDSVFTELLKYKAIEELPDGSVKATVIGKVSSWFYFTPFDVACWCFNLKNIAGKTKPTSEDIAWAIGSNHTAINDYPFAPSVKSVVYNSTIKKIQKEMCYQVLGGAGKHIAAMYCVLTNKEPDLPELSILVGKYRMDAERINMAVQCLNTQGRYFANAPSEHIIYELGVRMSYGMGDRAMELLVLPGIGKKTAQIILERNVSTAKQLLAAQTIGHKVLTDKKWATVKNATETVAMIGHVQYLKQKNRSTSKNDDDGTSDENRS